MYAEQLRAYKGCRVGRRRHRRLRRRRRRRRQRPGDTATPPACSPILYTVQAGDSLTSIADANMDTQQVDWIQICNRNMLPDCDVIEVGQELTIPCDVNLASAQSAEDGGGGGSGGAIAGIVIALLVLGALISLAIWKKKKQPGAAPPPPKQVIVEVGDATA